MTLVVALLAVPFAVPPAVAPAGAAPVVTAAELARMEAEAAALTAEAETARDEVLDAVARSNALRLQVDRLADERDAAQARVDAALVALYQRAALDAAPSLVPDLSGLNPALAHTYGAGVTRHQDVVDTLDAHAARLGALSRKADAFHAEVRDEAQRVYAAQDRAMTLLLTARAEYERRQAEARAAEERARFAADLARVQQQIDVVRSVSSDVATAATPGLGKRGRDALARETPIIERLVAAGAGYPQGYAPTGEVLHGVSSWYGPGFVGNPTASGAPYDPEKLTCAMRYVPLGTVVRVSRNGRAVNLLVNDRGPYIEGRIIDVSRAASRILGFDGLADVTIEILAPTG